LERRQCHPIGAASRIAVGRRIAHRGHHLAHVAARQPLPLADALTHVALRRLAIAAAAVTRA